MAPSDYENNARREIEAWKNPQVGWVGQALEIAVGGALSVTHPAAAK